MSKETEDQVKSAWDDVRRYFGRLQSGEATPADDPQPALAEHFFELWCTDPTAEDAETILRTAFIMWGNTRCADAVQRAIEQLDTAASYWEAPLQGASNAFHRAGRSEELLDLLLTYEQRLSHPASRSSILWILGYHWFRTGDSERAADCCARIIALNASPHHVQQAEGVVYELSSLAVGHTAPEFSATTIDGATLKLSDFRGRVVCLDFWATTCGPCLPEIPFLRRIRNDHSEQDVVLIGVSKDRDENVLRRFIETEQMSWPQILESVTWQGETAAIGPLSKLYNVWGIPRTILIDRTGRIAAKDLRGEKLTAAVDDLVAIP